MNLMRVANGTPARTRADQKRGGQGFDFRLIATSSTTLRSTTWRYYELVTVLIRRQKCCLIALARSSGALFELLVLTSVSQETEEIWILGTDADELSHSILVDSKADW